MEKTKKAFPVSGVNATCGTKDMRCKRGTVFLLFFFLAYVTFNNDEVQIQGFCQAACSSKIKFLSMVSLGRTRHPRFRSAVLQVLLLINTTANIAVKTIQHFITRWVKCLSLFKWVEVGVIFGVLVE